MDLDQLDRAGDIAATIARGVRPEQLSASTPCAEWTVQALMDHMIASLSYFAAVAAGEPGTQPGAAPPEARSPEARVDKLAKAAVAAAGAWRQPGALQRTKQTPMGEMTGEWYATVTLSELYVHAWDLAKATGQPFPEDASLSTAALNVARQNIRPEARQMGVIGPEVSLPDGASDLDRLLGFMGRQP